MFQREGQIPVQIVEVIFAEPKFAKGANDFDVCVRVVDVNDNAQADWWRGEVSANYGKGNFASMTQAEITMQSLRKIGFEGSDLSTLAQQLVGRKTVANVKAREHEGTTYYDVKYLGSGGNAPVAMDAGEALRRAAALFGWAADAQEGQQAAPSAPAQTQAPAAAAAPAKTFPPAQAKPAAGSPFGAPGAKPVNPWLKK